MVVSSVISVANFSVAGFKIPAKAAALFLLLSGLPAHARDDFALCPPFGPELPSLPALDPNTPAHAEADRGRYDGQRATLDGAAQLQYVDQRLLAEHIDYRLSPEHVEAEGNLRYWDSTRILFAEHGVFQPSSEQGQLDNVHFWLPAQHFSGTSSTVTRLSADNDQLKQVSLSSCPEVPPGETRDWTLDAASIDLNHASGRGVARDAWLHFKGVPLLYVPYFDFPLDDRRTSGFLYPSVNYNSQVGASVTIPYYWNIAPDRDATFTLHPMTQRGIMLGGEYRQLWESGNAKALGNLLPHDNDTGDTRYLYDIQASQRLAEWSGSLAVRHASDMNYMRDFGLSSYTSNAAYLESHASAQRTFNSSINEQTGQWNVLLLAQEFQNLSYSVNNANLPYKRMPQFLVQGVQPIGSLRFSLLGEAVNFQSEYAANPEGGRYALIPKIEAPLGDSWYSITPAVAMSSVQYQVAGSSFAQNVPIASLDTRLYFDQFGDTLHQQLEPHLYYLYAPYREQNAPLFDTAQPLPSLSRLFDSNRFIGRDRQGDANALSYALTWRALDAAEGYERLSVGLGQQYLFSDERVTLNPGDPITPRGAGEAIVELNAGFTREWGARITASSSQTYGVLSYRPRFGSNEAQLQNQQRIVNLYYGTQTQVSGLPDLNQIGLSFVWPIDRQWQVLGNVAQDLDAQQPLQLLAGLAYESCCWRVKLGAEYYVISNPNPNIIEYTTAALLQFELKGLGGLGSQADQRFERAILGYQPDLNSRTSAFNGAQH
jgi:LPS-assembly protein